MKHNVFSTALFVLIALWTKQLYAQDIHFGSLPSGFRYQKSGGYETQHTVIFSQGSTGENEQQQSNILVSVDDNEPFSVAPLVIQDLNSLTMSEQTKVNLLIAFIIIQQELVGYTPLEDSDTNTGNNAETNTNNSHTATNADRNDGSNARNNRRFTVDRYTFTIPSAKNTENPYDYDLIASVPVDSHNDWFLDIQTPSLMQFQVTMSPPPAEVVESVSTQVNQNDTSDEDDPDDPGSSCFSPCARGLMFRIKSAFTH